MNVNPASTSHLSIVATGKGPALREILSGQARETTKKIDALTEGIDRLQDHVKKMEHERAAAQGELDAHMAALKKSQGHLKLSLPAIVLGAGLGVAGTFIQAFAPCLGGIIAVGAGSALVAAGGILANTCNMNQTESRIRGNGAKDKLDVFDAALVRTHTSITANQKELEALKKQDAELLERATAELSRPAIAPGTITMESESVRIGNLTLPRRADG